MTDPNTASTARPAVRAQTLPLQGIVNRVIRALLRTPLLGRAVGRRLLTVHFVGRRSGRHYAAPVAYTRHNGSLLVGSQFAWIRNLHTGEHIHIRLAGKDRLAEVRILTDEVAVVEHLAMMARDNHQFARFNRIALDSGGNPLPQDLHLAWASGARIAVLTPR